ncbi:hypothetical protein GCM10007874_67620 [Labrys miyagiensis]|uniref:Uncharacterized protein n=1 Tax=Labrys miyagiensis TaxID=346912 RepID=A0ABQ6CTP2_9HYPH|nr:hypothetical protein [Labrys miyagiensis]GLS23741.1 hypothetical protein GCM10007874_67620 [Labrys miyagiensis]
MLLASAVDISIGWLWHTAYRARWHWKLKREGALVAAGFVALVGVIDTARSLYSAHPTTQGQTATITTPAPGAAPQPVVASTVPAAIAPAATAQQPVGSTVQAYSDPSTPQFPIIQDQTGSIDQADPVETILPMDPAAQKDDPIARKINERFGDAAEAPAVHKPKPKPVKTAASKPAKPAKPAKKPADDPSTN